MPGRSSSTFVPALMDETLTDGGAPLVLLAAIHQEQSLIIKIKTVAGCCWLWWGSSPRCNVAMHVVYMLALTFLRKQWSCVLHKQTDSTSRRILLN
jgi:hypothetical protein